jgi:peroxiredoxin Q/BCP
VRRPARALLLAVAAVALAGAAQAADLLTAGGTFPTWSMRDQKGATVTSQDLAGKTYLLWYYPKAGTPGCTAEGIALRETYPKLQAAGVEVLGVSFDEPADNAAFAEAQQFPFRLLSDDGALAVQVGAATSRDQGATRRISYLIGPDGKILKAYDSVDPKAHAQQVLSDATTKPAS